MNLASARICSRCFEFYGNQFFVRFVRAEFFKLQVQRNIYGSCSRRRDFLMNERVDAPRGSDQDSNRLDPGIKPFAKASLWRIGLVHLRRWSWSRYRDAMTDMIFLAAADPIRSCCVAATIFGHRL